MKNRTQQVTELMEGFHSLRRSMAFRTKGTSLVPRITPSQWGVLMTIKAQEGNTVKDAARALGISSSAATQLIDGLVLSGYVVRQEDIKDRRRVTLSLSRRTKTQVEHMKKESTQQFLKLFAALTDTEFDHYVLLTKKIIEKSAKEIIKK